MVKFPAILQTTMNTQSEVRIQAVHAYLNGKECMRKTAKQIGIDHTTLWRWAKWYKKGGEDNLVRKKPYCRPWNRPSPEVERTIASLKEKHPSLTLKNAQKKLAKNKIEISINGIWCIWKRYALTARSPDTPYTPFGPHTPETESALRIAGQFLRKGEVRSSANTLNALPAFPNDPVIDEIPEKFLSPRRQLDQLYFRFGTIPFSEYLRKVSKIRKTLEKQNLIYSSIFAGLGEFLALSWLVNPKKEKDIMTMLKKHTEGIRDPSLQFLVAMHEGIMHGASLHGTNAKSCIRVCMSLLRRLPHPFFLDSMGTLYTKITDYKNASRFWMKALKQAQQEDYKKVILWKVAYAHAMAGRYQWSIRFLRDAERKNEGIRSSITIIYASCAFGRGDMLQAAQFLKQALDESERGQLRNHLATAAFGLAAIQAALGNEKGANRMLRKYIPLFKKHNMKLELAMRNMILGNLNIDKTMEIFPVFKLFKLLQNATRYGEYYKALRFALNHNLLGYFHRIILFFPQPIQKLLKQGKPTKLPRAILNLPVFRADIPVYTINFLGELIVYKNQKYLKAKCSTKDTSFLIFLACTETKSISLEDVYKNFWVHSTQPARNLAHLLVRIRKALQLPSHYLYIKENTLFFDCYFSTDYSNYQEHLAQAKALLRAGEWGFAKQEFAQAFKLFRGEPFRKMYDDWSDDKRLEVLFSYETEVLSFAKELRKRGRKKVAEKFLKRAEKIVTLHDESH